MNLNNLTLVFLCFAGPLLAVENIAPQATVTASAERKDSLAARYVVDGNIPIPGSKDDDHQAWAASTNLAETATLTFTWPAPKTIATIVYYGRTAWGLEMCWKDYEIYVDNQPAPVARGTFQSAHGPQPVALPAPVRAGKLTIKFLSHYSSKGAPGASEVQILDGPPPASAKLGAFAATELDVRYAYFPSHDLVRFLVPQPPAGATAWQIALWSELADAPLAQRSGTLPMSAAGENLVVPKLPAGNYRLRFTFTGGAAPVIEDRAFLRRQFEWEGQHLGLEDVIIPPFEPLTVANQTVGSVLRQHTHGTAGLWRQVVSRGHELLAAPVRLEAGGKAVAGESPTFKAVKPTQVTGTATWKGGTTEFAYDYDGLMQVKLRILPGAIERLQLVIPLKASEAWLMHPVTTELRQHYAGRIPAGEGKVWDSSKVPNLVGGRFVPYIYVGGPERGICFAADNDRDWINDPAVPAMEIERVGDTVNLRLNLIAKPAQLTRERTITFALQATPAKPMPETPLNWRRWWATRTAKDVEDVQLSFFGGNQYWGGRYFASSLYPAFEDFGFWSQLAKHRQTGKVEAGYLESFLAKFTGASQEELANLRAHFNEGLRLASEAPVITPDMKKFKVVIPYTNPRGLSKENRGFATTYLDEWQRADIADPRWDKADRVTRQSKNNAVWYDIEPVPSFVDMALFYHKKMYETFSDGIYWDNFFLKPCYVPAEAGGPAYVDDEGRLRPGVNLMAFRNLVKRNAALMHRLGKRPLSFIHMTNVNIIPMLSFGTLQLDWEWRDQGSYANKDLQDRLGADRDTALILAQSLGLQAGNINVAINRFESAKNPDWLMRTVLAVCVPHEIKIQQGNSTVAKVQTQLAQFGYGTPDCKVYRYWEPGFPLQTDGANTRALVLSRPGKTLLAIGNYGSASPTGVQTAPAPSLEEYDRGQKRPNPTSESPSATETYRITLRLDLQSLGLSEKARAEEVDLSPPKKGQKNLALDITELKSPSPGLFELSMRKHDFALVLIEQPENK